MFVRLTSCKFSPDSIPEVKRIFQQEIVPAVRGQEGNMGILLLEPVDKSDDFVSVSRWRNKSDADAYENAGMYKTLIGKLASFLAKEPVLRCYEAEDVPVPAN